MTERSRAFYDADNEREYASPTSYKTGENIYEISCSICSAKVFANELVRDNVQRAIEKTSENPFVCTDCSSEYDELAHQ